MEKSLLLVDDEQNILRSLRRLLRSDGYTIHTASSGKEGLEILKEHSVCVILSDMCMPEMSGAEFLAKVKEQYPETIRLMLSGYTDLTSVTDAINQGAIFKFLTKPWEDDEIKQSISEAFTQYQKDKGGAGFEQNSNSIASISSQNSTPSGGVNYQGILAHLSVGVIVIGSNESVKFINDYAKKLLSVDSTTLESSQASSALTNEILAIPETDSDDSQHTVLTLENGVSVNVKRSKKQRIQGEEVSIIAIFRQS